MRESRAEYEADGDRRNKLPGDHFVPSGKPGADRPMGSDLEHVTGSGISERTI